MIILAGAVLGFEGEGSWELIKEEGTFGDRMSEEEGLGEVGEEGT